MGIPKCPTWTPLSSVHIDLSDSDSSSSASDTTTYSEISSDSSSVDSVLSEKTPVTAIKLLRLPPFYWDLEDHIGGNPDSEDSEVEPLSLAIPNAVSDDTSTRKRSFSRLEPINQAQEHKRQRSSSSPFSQSPEPTKSSETEPGDRGSEERGEVDLEYHYRCMQETLDQLRESTVRMREIKALLRQGRVAQRTPLEDSELGGKAAAVQALMSYWATTTRLRDDFAEGRADAAGFAWGRQLAVETLDGLLKDAERECMAVVSQKQGAESHISKCEREIVDEQVVQKVLKARLHRATAP
ncbi:hypothetical protein E4T38_01586 [Aureobasidium subglaciale]|nr:hypothetical protein E4T38_01586 [Aureobasidium subglaciale]KAI5219135.1 hypothetical protein E4T40_06562 [Aureobasidium subglaciale]KAI5233114.1 hypothetical protein E4T41_01584 [Aureobasidium subglaciale]KAI5260016.1 hypothetical protein E4T46_06362 [Aureobasidium subglaciale]